MKKMNKQQTMKNKPNLMLEKCKTKKWLTKTFLLLIVAISTIKCTEDKVALNKNIVETIPKNEISFMEFKNKTGLKNIETDVRLQINSFKSRKNKNKTSAYEINDFTIDITYIKQLVIQDNFTYSFKIIPTIIKRNSFFNLTVFRKNGVWETSVI
ncbi:hypothetical protein [Flavobacterium sp. ACAM 123]|jgi:hypothetical protein|uniref:hypothetical protein n=1 Tax=Flavobacterium sp. ACAM 123 TaxID=1189620 RepID=UPI0002E1FA79|nr:hypothetical protein [Flavobacterium sp. ACAM 123]